MREGIGKEDIIEVWFQYDVTDEIEVYDDFTEIAEDEKNFNYIVHHFGVILREY